MSRRPRRNHSPTFKAKVALAAVQGDKTLAELSQHFDMSYCQIWCSGAESSGGLIDVCYFDSVFEFHSGDHLREISESA